MKRYLILFLVVFIVALYALSCMTPPGCGRSEEAKRLFNKGTTEYKNGKYEKAIEYYTEAINIRPKESDYYYTRGKAYSVLGKETEAIADYTKAINIDSSREEYYYNRGIVYSKLGQENNAIEDYTKAIDINPGYAEYYYERGLVYNKIEKYNEAITDYTKAVDLGMYNIEVYNNRGLAYEAIGEKDKALIDFDVVNKIKKKVKEEEEKKRIAEEKRRIEEEKKKEERRIAEEKKRIEEEKKRIAKEKRLKEALGKMRVKEDDFEGITWYTDRSSPQKNSANGFFIYIVKRGNSSPKLRLRVQYYGSQWLLISSFTVKADNKKYDVRGNFERDNYTMIWEWYDSALSAKDLGMIKAIIASKKTTVRFYGMQYYDDRTITNEQKRALQNVLDAFEALGGHL